MTELISIKHLSKDTKIELLKGLGYGSDGTFVLDDKGEKHLDRYINEPIKIDHMIILPGSAIVLDDNPISIASYFEDYPDVFE